MRKFLLIIVALLFCAACNKQVVDLPADQLAVVVAPAITDEPVRAPSKADTYTFFAKNSQVGLYIVNYNGQVPGVLANTGNQSDNECFTADDNGILRKTPPVFYPAPDVATKVDIYAYYPYTVDMATNVRSCPFAVELDQSVAANVSKSDLCWAKNLRASQEQGIEPTSKPLAMEFVHKFSKIMISLNVSPISPSGKAVTGVANVKVNGVYPGVTLDLVSGNTTLKNGVADSHSTITPTVLQAGTPGTTEYKYEVIVPAQPFTVGYNLITFELNYADGTHSELSYKVSAGTFGPAGNSAQAGKLHKINLTLNAAWEVTLTGSQITDWVTGISHSGKVDNLVTTSFLVTLSDAAVTTVNRVVVTTDYEGSFDIKTGVTFVMGVCKFKFETGMTPRDYGFRITKLDFYNGDALVKSVTKTSARVYTTGEMNLGTWN